MAGFRGRANYYLNELGIALFYPNVRGSTGYGKRFVSLDNGPFKREDSVKDMAALIDAASADPRVASLEEQLAAATDEAEQARLRAELDSERTAVRSDKLGEVAAEFEAIHDIERAQRVGSVHRIVAARDLRAELVAAVERKMA